MKIHTAIASALMFGMVATPASAQVMTVSQVLSECPDFDAAMACPATATAFLDSRPMGPRTNEEVVNLVLVLAEAAQQPRVTLPVCLDTADGMRVLASGMSDTAQAQQVLDIADALCLDTTTAAIGDVGPDGSLASDGGAGAGTISTNDGNGTDDGNGTGGDGDGTGGDGDGDDNGDGGGLGSNNAANVSNDNANDSAQDNDSGQN